MAVLKAENKVKPVAPADLALAPEDADAGASAFQKAEETEGWHNVGQGHLPEDQDEAMRQFHREMRDYHLALGESAEHPEVAAEHRKHAHEHHKKLGETYVERLPIQMMSADMSKDDKDESKADKKEKQKDKAEREAAYLTGKDDAEDEAEAKGEGEEGNEKEQGSEQEQEQAAADQGKGGAGAGGEEESEAAAAQAEEDEEEAKDEAERQPTDVSVAGTEEMDAARAREILAEKFKLQVPEGLTPAESWKHLITAALNKEGDEDVDDQQQMQEDEAKEEPMQVSMSRREPVPVAPMPAAPKTKAVNMSLTERRLQARVAKLEEKLATKELADYQRRLAPYASSANPKVKAEATSIYNDLSAHNMSLVNGDNNAQVAKALVRLEMLEKFADLSIGDLTEQQTEGYIPEGQQLLQGDADEQTDMSHGEPIPAWHWNSANSDKAQLAAAAEMAAMNNGSGR